MEQKINVSSFLPLKVKSIEGNNLEILFKNIFEAYFNVQDIKNYLKKKFNDTNLELLITIQDNSDLLFQFKSIIELPEIDTIKYFLENYFAFNLGKTLVNKYTKRDIIFINKATKIPLIGTTAFGIIYRNTNIIEIRPISGCPLNCIFCSVDEGPNSKLRVRDFLIEEQFLIEEVEKIINYIGNKEIEAHISSQGEPLIYPYMIDLIKDLKKINGIKFISLQTNGFLLNSELIQQLKEAGLDRINLSINTLDEKKAIKMTACKDYDINKIKKIAKEIIAANIDLLIAPVLVPSINEDDMEEIINFSKEIGAGKLGIPLGIQNYLEYKFSRKVKNIDKWIWSDFRQYLEKMEKKFDIKPLYLSKKDFNIHQRKPLPQPLKKNQTLSVEIKLMGRMETEKFAVYNDRIIQIINCKKALNSKVKIKILSVKENIITAQEV